MLELPHPLLAGGVDVERVVGNAGHVEVEPRAPDEEAHEDDGRNGDPEDLEQFGRLVLLRQLIVRTAAELDGEIEDGEEYADGNRAADEDQEDIEVVDVGSERRRLIGPERKIRNHHRFEFRSFLSMMKMKPPRLRIVAMPPARTMFMAVLLYLPVDGS